MAGHSFCIFGTAIGRCGITWGSRGINGVQLPMGSEDKTRTRMRQAHGDIAEAPPPAEVQRAVEGIVELLAGKPNDLSDVVLDQMKLRLEAAGSSLAQVVKCNVYCTPDPSHFEKFNEVYARYFPDASPARIFLHVPSWPGPFDVEVDCVAVL